MSDFSSSVKCPRCGGRFSPDDGLCCPPVEFICSGCGELKYEDELADGYHDFCKECAAEEDNGLLDSSEEPLLIEQA